MPTFLPPTVVGPLSPCSRTVTVRGIVPGQPVGVFQDGEQIAGAHGVWPTQQIGLDEGVTLKAGSPVYASQGGDGVAVASFQSAQVLALPTGLVVGAVTLVSHLYVGAQCLWIDGAIPGATVKVFASSPLSSSQTSAGLSVGGISRGTGELNLSKVLIGYAEAAYGGAARVKLTQPVGANDTIFIQQSVQVPDGGYFEGPVTRQPAPDSLFYVGGVSGPGQWSEGPKVPAPVFDGTLYAGQQAVRVEGILEGGTVTIGVVEGNFVESECVDRTGVWLALPPGLQVDAGGGYWVSQALGTASSAQSFLAQGDGDGPPLPTIPGPVCAGDAYVLLTGLIVGAQVTISVGDEVVGIGVAPSATYAFPVSAAGDLTAADVADGLGARMSLTGSSATAQLAIQDQGYAANFSATVPFLSPLFEGARAVHVGGDAPGSPTGSGEIPPGMTVFIRSATWGVIGTAKSSAPWFVGGEGDVPVAPALTAGDTIEVLAYPPGTFTLYPPPIPYLSNAVTVQALGQGTLPAPQVQNPPQIINGEIPVTGITPGADVDVFVRASASSPDVFYGTAVATQDTFGIPSTSGLVTLAPGNQIHARQRIAGQISDLSVYVTIQEVGADPVLASDTATQYCCVVAGCNDLPRWYYGMTVAGLIPTWTTIELFASVAPNDSWPPSGAPNTGGESHVGTGTDVGLPLDVTYQGQTYTVFFFGDTSTNSGTIKPVGYTTDAFPHQMSTDGATPEAFPQALQAANITPPQEVPFGLSIQYLTGPSQLARSISAPGFYPQYSLNGPTGAFSIGDDVYLFVLSISNDSANPNDSSASNLLLHTTVDRLFDATSNEISFPDSYTISVAANGPEAFKFCNVSPTLIRNANLPILTDPSSSVPGLPKEAGGYEYGVLLFGSGPFRGNGGPSNMSLGWMPVELDAQGSPVVNQASVNALQYWTNKVGSWWSLSQSDAFGLLPTPPAAPTSFAWDLGELSVFWDDVFARWIVFFNTGALAGVYGVTYYSSPAPWGPWSTPDPNSAANFLLTLGPYFNPYGPWRVLRYSSWNPWTRTRTVFFMNSTIGKPNTLPPDPLYACYLFRTAFTYAS